MLAIPAPRANSSIAALISDSRTTLIQIVTNASPDTPAASQPGPVRCRTRDSKAMTVTACNTVTAADKPEAREAAKTVPDRAIWAPFDSHESSVAEMVKTRL